MHDMLDDAIFSRSVEDFVVYGAKVSGLTPTDVMQLIPSLKDLSSRVDFKTPITAAEDGATLSALMMRLFQLAGPALFEDPAMADFGRTVMQVAGFGNRTNELGFAKDRRLKPMDEHLMMMAGTHVNPKSFDNDAQHVSEHTAFMIQLQSGNGGVERAFLPQVLSLLGLHIQQHLDMMALKQMSQQQGRGVNDGTQGGGGGLAQTPQLANPEIAGSLPAPAEGLGNNVSERANAPSLV
jgi:hypothetical protein